MEERVPSWIKSLLKHSENFRIIIQSNSRASVDVFSENGHVSMAKITSRCLAIVDRGNSLSQDFAFKMYMFLNCI